MAKPTEIENTAQDMAKIVADSNPASQLSSVNREAQQVVRYLHSIRGGEDFKGEAQKASDLFRTNGFEDQANIIAEYAGKNPGEMSNADALQAREEAQKQFREASLHAQNEQHAQVQAEYIAADAAHNDKPPLDEYIAQLAANTQEKISQITMADVKAAEIEIAGGEENLQRMREDLAARAGVSVDQIPTSDDYTQADVEALIQKSGAVEIIAGIPAGLEQRISETEAQLPAIQEAAIQPHLEAAQRIQAGVASGEFAGVNGATALMQDSLDRKLDDKFPEHKEAISSRLEGSRGYIEAGYNEKMDGYTAPVSLDVQDTLIASAEVNVISSREFRDAMRENPDAAIQALPEMVKEELNGDIEQRFSRFEAPDPVAAQPVAPAAEVTPLSVVTEQRYDEYSKLPAAAQDQMLKMLEKQIAKDPSLEEALKPNVDALNRLQDERGDPSASVSSPVLMGMKV